jgi:uncharacterized protein (DUF488 family)
MKLFTVGYESRSLDELIDILREHGIDLLADIRAVPHSRRREFSKKTLSRVLPGDGIEYLHIGSLGSPKELRDKVKADGNYDYFFSRYEEFLGSQDASLRTLSALIRKKVVCLLCYERDVDKCHRRAVAERMAKMAGRDIDIIHL